MRQASSRQAVDRITLDREVFKALASDTRLDILKALDVRQKTVTELAKELDLNKATVFEHLEKLQTVGLIQKLEDERKWVYWQLTWTGKRLLHPEKITLAILLSTAGGSMVTAVAAIWLWLKSGLVPATEEADMKEISIRAAPVEDMPPADQAAGLDPMFLALAIAFGLVAILLVSWAVRVHLRARQPAEATTG